jgi:hypothetical protein
MDIHAIVLWAFVPFLMGIRAIVLWALVTLL